MQGHHFTLRVPFVTPCRATVAYEPTASRHARWNSSNVGWRKSDKIQTLNVQSALLSQENCEIWRSYEIAMKNILFRSATPCNLAARYRIFAKPAASIFRKKEYPKDGGSKFLLCKILPNYTAWQTRIQNCSIHRYLRFLQALTTEFNWVKFSVIMNRVSYLKRIFHPYSMSVCHPGS